MRRAPAPRWLTILCCLLAGIALALALACTVLAVSTAPEASASSSTQSDSVAPEETEQAASSVSSDSTQTDSAPAETETETETQTPEPISSRTVSSALLYRLEDGVLEYDVTHTSQAENATVVDLTGAQISTQSELSSLLEEQVWAFTADLILDDSERVTAICLTQRVLRPVIGISWKADDQDYSSYKEVLLRNGATPVELPQITDTASAQTALSQVAGIMVTGGEDIDPALYGDEVTENGANDINSVRDTSDYYLIQAAIAQDLPMLAICRGCQMLNVALGGGLIQDITTYLEENSLPLPAETGVYHKNDGSQYHDINRISSDSLWFASIIGGDRYPNAATFHHQAIDPDRVAQGLTPVAWTDDGMIEAVEYQANRFALGIQFHPERDALGDTLDVDTDQDTCNRFFRALITAAAGD